MLRQSIPPPPDNSPIELSTTRRSRKKLFVTVAIVIIIALVSTIAVAVVFSNNGLLVQGENVTLGFKYSVGEKMDYGLRMTTSVSVQTTPGTTPQTTEQTTTGTITEEIISVEGDTFTKSVTTKISSPSSASSSYTVTMDKTGRVLNYANLPQEVQQLFSSFTTLPGFGSYFPRQEVKVGEIWSVPMNVQLNGIRYEGAINYKIVNVKEITVPAGTFNSIGIDITANNIKMSITSSGSTVELFVNYNGHLDIEKGTSRIILYDIKGTTTGTVAGETGTIKATLLMQLTQYTP
jgi:hypothetical protein